MESAAVNRVECIQYKLQVHERDGMTDRPACMIVASSPTVRVNANDHYERVSRKIIFVELKRLLKIKIVAGWRRRRRRRSIHLVRDHSIRQPAASTDSTLFVGTSRVSQSQTIVWLPTTPTTTAAREKLLCVVPF